MQRATGDEGWLYKLLVLGWSIMMAATPALSQPNNEGQLLFELANESRSQTSIVKSNPDGTSPMVLATTGEYPLWFPKKDRVTYFVSRKNIHKPSRWSVGDTYISDLNGNVLKIIPYFVMDISPDGNKLLVEVLLDDEKESWGIGYYDLSVDKLTLLLTKDNFPSGQRPYVTRWLASNDTVIFSIAPWIGIPLPKFGTMSIHDGNLRLFDVPEKILPTGSFDVSSDGRKVVFAGWPEAEYPQRGKGGIYIFDLMENSIQLAHREPAHFFIGGVAWSPNEKQIVFAVTISESYESALKIVNSDGTRAHRVYPVSTLHEMSNMLGWSYHEWRAHADWR